MRDGLDLESLGLSTESFEDGHRPGGSNESASLVRLKDESATFMVFDGVLGEEWRNAAYQFALKHNRPWGAYVTNDDAENLSLVPEDIFASDPIRAVALKATRELVYKKGLYQKDLQHLLKVTAGTAVWCLVSGVDDEVRYHIDYAELYRYETGIIHIPCIAGTIHLSPLNEDDIEGGVFMVTTEGIDHYRKFGYKGCNGSECELQSDIQFNPSWKSVPYSGDRGILHSGSWPHLSTKITRIGPTHVKRVILGVNVFAGFNVDKCCRRAPEHSDVFNRTVKLYQAMSRVDMPITTDEKEDALQPETPSGRKLIDVKAILKNKALSRLIVLAANKCKDLRRQSEGEC